MAADKRIKQLSINDWLRLFGEQPSTIEAVSVIELARKRRPLASYEENCLRAWEQWQKRIAAE